MGWGRGTGPGPSGKGKDEKRAFFFESMGDSRALAWIHRAGSGKGPFSHNENEMVRV